MYDVISLHKCLTDLKNVFNGLEQYVLPSSLKNIIRVLQNGDNNMIVLSGCGTSGRIAFQTFVSTRCFNKNTHAYFALYLETS